jgi:hypothetical protein
MRRAAKAIDLARRPVRGFVDGLMGSLGDAFDLGSGCGAGRIRVAAQIGITAEGGVPAHRERSVHGRSFMEK